MRDPYLYDDVNVLRNIGGIKDSEKLRTAEGEVTKLTIPMVYAQKFIKFNIEALCEIHYTIFNSLYEWAGEFRTIPIAKYEEVLGGDTVRYTHPSKIKEELSEAVREISKLKKTEDKAALVFKIVRVTAKIWKIHPFRDGNTRAIISFAVLLAEHLGIDVRHRLFEKHAAYVRNSLVCASQGIYSNFEHLEKIFYDAAGIDFFGSLGTSSKHGEYDMIGDYNLADYTEVPHVQLLDE